MGNRFQQLQLAFSFSYSIKAAPKPKAALKVAPEGKKKKNTARFQTHEEGRAKNKLFYTEAATS